MAASSKTWVDNSPPQCAAADLNGFNKENNNLITSSGMGLDSADNTQTGVAVSVYAGAGDYFNETGSGNTYILAPTTLSGGTLYAPSAYHDGQRIRFIATHSNTGPATINLNAIGPIDIVTATGGALIGGEISVSSYYEMIYSLNLGVFLMQATGEIPVGTEWSYAGYVSPTGFLFEDGSAVLRATYGALLGVITFTLTGNTTSGQPQITGLSTTANMWPGMQITSANFTGALTILSVDGGTQVTLSGNATTTGSVVTRFYPYGAGDGVNTFNLPDARGRAFIGAGLGAGLTNRILGNQLGEETHTQTLLEGFPHDHLMGGKFTNEVTGSDDNHPLMAADAGNSATASAGGGHAFNIMQPSTVRNIIIKY